MSRKNKTLRAFLHQNPNPTIEQAWDAAWKHAQKTFHAMSMQDMEKQVAGLQVECERLREKVAALVGALEDALASLEEYAVMVDWEWGCCRNLGQLEADDELPQCVKDARAALSAYRDQQEKSHDNQQTYAE